jgi:hypothetical protein
VDKIFWDINNWFRINQLVLNYNKTHYLQFKTRNSRNYDLKITIREIILKALQTQNF